MVEVDLLIFGSGSLTRELIVALAALPQPKLSIMLAARNEKVLREIESLAHMRAAEINEPITLTCTICDYSEQALDNLFQDVRPQVVLTLASIQSPWRMGPRWRKLVAEVGFGITLPLQAKLAYSIFRALRRRHTKTICVNGCYPDMVNNLLVERGIDVFGGLGNIAILASFLNRQYSKRKVALLAHHAHISALIKKQSKGVPPPHIWIDNQLITNEESKELIGRLSLPDDETLNIVTASTAVPMLQALLGRSTSWLGHVPGVNGLVGGYPVNVDVHGFTIKLPSELSLDDAIAINSQYSHSDGIVVVNGNYRLTKTADEIMHATNIKLPDALLSWHADELNDQANQLEALRLTLDPTWCY